MVRREIGLLEMTRALPEVLGKVATQEEVFITQNGKPIGVLISPSAYELLTAGGRSVRFAEDALRYLDRESAGVRQSLLSRIRRLADYPYPPDSRSVRKPIGARRVKVGSYRIIYTVFDGSICVYRVGTREEVYGHC
jgi:prevent-host-death family protein